MAFNSDHKKILKILLRVILMTLLFFVLSVIIVNIVRPAIHKDVSEEYKRYVSETDFTGDTEGTERIRCIDSNEEALVWRLRMIAAAKETVVLTTFDLRTDENGTYICAALLDAADRGVKVKLLIDGIYEPVTLNNNDVFLALCANPNVEAKIYNPIKLTNIYDVNYRMHDKYLMVDGKMYMLGGRNTCDIFLGEEHAGSNIDRDILVYNTDEKKGASYIQLEEYFQAIWNERCAKKVSVKAGSGTDKEQESLHDIYSELNGQIEAFADFDDWISGTYGADKITLISNGTNAGNKEPRILYVIESLATDSKDVTIQTPYVICNKYMYNALSNINKTSKVRLYINAVERGSNPWGCTDYLNNKDKVLDTGSDVYEVMNKYAIHTKAFLIDDNISILGSYNLDMRSTYLDTELMLVIDSEELNAHIRSMLDYYQSESMEVLADKTETKGENYTDRELPWNKKISYGILRVLTVPIRHLL